MRAEVSRDLSKSARAFRDVVWPAIKGKLRGGDIMHVEATENENMRQKLDMLAGIDAWQVCDLDGRMRGIASRVQGPNNRGKPYRTFSIRTSRPSGGETEWGKRIAAIKDNGEWLLPALTVQAYMTDDTFVTLAVAGIVFTKELYEFIDRIGVDSFHSFENLDGSSTFLVCPWARLTCGGVRVKEAGNQSNCEQLPLWGESNSKG